MTEDEWLACGDPRKMLGFLNGKASGRKLRLFAVACCRRVWHLLADERGRRAVETAERFVDGLSNAEELTVAYYGANAALLATDPLDDCCRDAAELACAVAYTAHLHGVSCTYMAANAVADAVADASVNAIAFVRAKCEELAVQCRLVLDIFGGPSRPVTFDAARLTPLAMSLARAAYDNRILPAGHLDPVRLAVLSDALEEAGCTDSALLSHLRSPGPHIQGCWAVDLVLGKE